MLKREQSASGSLTKNGAYEGPIGLKRVHQLIKAHWIPKVQLGSKGFTENDLSSKRLTGLAKMGSKSLIVLNENRSSVKVVIGLKMDHWAQKGSKGLNEVAHIFIQRKDKGINW